jgi:hypothetical protein
MTRQFNEDIGRRPVQPSIRSQRSKQGSNNAHHQESRGQKAGAQTGA